MTELTRPIVFGLCAAALAGACGANLETASTSSANAPGVANNCPANEQITTRLSVGDLGSSQRGGGAAGATLGVPTMRISQLDIKYYWTGVVSQPVTGDAAAGECVFGGKRYRSVIGNTHTRTYVFGNSVEVDLAWDIAEPSNEAEWNAELTQANNGWTLEPGSPCLHASLIVHRTNNGVPLGACTSDQLNECGWTNNCAADCNSAHEGSPDTLNACMAMCECVNGLAPVSIKRIHKIDF